MFLGRLPSPGLLPQRILHGDRDWIVPIELTSDYVKAARASGDEAQLQALAETGHFELIDPESPAWPAARDAVLSLLKKQSLIRVNPPDPCHPWAISNSRTPPPRNRSR